MLARFANVDARSFFMERDRVSNDLISRSEQPFEPFRMHDQAPRAHSLQDAMRRDFLGGATILTSHLTVTGPASVSSVTGPV
jgi:hypothetical protein